MALVGDVILGCREAMTDLPPTLGALGLPPILAPVSGSNLLPPGTYYVVVTQLTPWGETLPSPEASITLSSVSNISVQPFGLSGLATAVRVYFSTTSGTETFYQQFQFSSIFGTGVFTINATTGVGAMSASSQSPPIRSSAYMPDSDGQAVSAFAIYRWLNQALGWAAAKNRGGLPDFGAAGTVGGQPNYILPGYWKKIDAAWYDGYPLGLLQKNNVFRRNPVPGYSGMLTVFQATDRLMVEAWPQPSRTSAQTTLAAPMLATDTVATLTSTAGFVLGFGMAQIDSEIVNFAAINGNQLTGLQRGMTGTVAATHSATFGSVAPVTELNLMISGFRVPSTSSYFPGQAATPLYLPPGWDEALISYMLYRFRKLEQDEAGAKAALQEATEKIGSLGANRVIAGPRQVQPYGAVGPEVAAGMGSRFGGVIIP
jgi:hypothetical protein